MPATLSYNSTATPLLRRSKSVFAHTIFIPFPRPTFTGKELDEETGYGYFGARYYDATLLTSWTAVDPMADKYPSLSPYNYCAWNPMKLVDPDGNDWYETDKGDIKWTNFHSQKEMKANGMQGTYLGVTAESNGKYYSLFNNVENNGEPLDANSESGKFVKHMDQAIIKRAMSSTAFGKNTIEDFGDVVPHKSGWKSINFQNMDYAGGEATLMVNGTSMKASFNPQEKSDAIGGPNAGVNIIKAPRFDFRDYNRTMYCKSGVPIVSLSFNGRPNALKQFNKMWEFLSSRTVVFSAARTTTGWKQTAYIKQ